MGKEEKYIWSENYLLSQGYNKEDINKYFHINIEIIKKIKKELFDKIIENKKQDKKCVFLFGQPGCGKSTYMKKNYLESYVILDIDEYRQIYPFKDELIQLIEAHHQNHNLPKENSKGRDFTNFTRKFIGILLDELLDECIKQGYNIALQKHASDYKVFEDIFKKLVSNLYEINLILLLVDSLTSWERCEKRNEINNMTLNTVPKDFHDNYIKKIPQTIVDIILKYIIEESYVTKIEIVDNEQKIIFDKNSAFDYDCIKEYIYNAINHKKTN